MMVLWEKEKVHEKDLVDILMLKSNTLTPLIKKLEKKGLLQISRDKNDKRNVIISLTSVGEKLKEKAVNVPINYSKNFPLGKKEVDELKKSLNKLINGRIGNIS